MNYSKEDIEYYLINKEYHELTADELGFISSEVKSEKEFNQLKKLMDSLLIQNEAEIQPDPAIKSVLMNEFRQKSKFNKIWYNSLVIQLFPKDKKIHRMPGVQLAGIAASLLLIINIVFIDPPFKNNNEIAMENTDEVIETKITINNEKNKTIDETTPTINTDKSLENSISTNEIPNKPEIIVTENNIQLSEVTTLDEVSEVLIEKELSMSNQAILTDEGVVHINMLEDDIEEELKSTSIISNDSSYGGDVALYDYNKERLALSGYTEPTVDNTIGNSYETIEEIEINAEMINKDVANGRIRKVNAVISSRSLNDDKELIDLFFTAM